MQTTSTLCMFLICLFQVCFVKTDTVSNARHISAELFNTRGEIKVELTKSEECQSRQYSCVADLVDKQGHVTVKKSVLDGKIGSDVGLSLDNVDSKKLSSSYSLALATKRTTVIEKVEHLEVLLMEKLKCIETRLEDSYSAGSRLDEKLDDLIAKLIDKINSLGKDAGDKIVSSEMRIEDKMERFKDRLEDKIMSIYLENPNRKTFGESCLNPNSLIANIFESVQLMQQNLTDLGFDFTYNIPSLATNDTTGQTCAMLRCVETLAESSTGSRKLLALTIYRFADQSAQEGKKWDQLATVTQDSSQMDSESDARHVRAVLYNTKGELEVQLTKSEECQSRQYSCVADLVDEQGHVTLKKSVLDSRIGSDAALRLDNVDSKKVNPSYSLASATKETGVIEKVEQLEVLLMEKLKCIETRLEDSHSAGSRLDEKLDDFNAKLIDKINSLGKEAGNKIVSSEMRVEENMERFKDRMEDKMMDLFLEKPSSIASTETFRKQNSLIANVFESIQSMQQNLTDFSGQVDQVKTTLTRSQSHLDSKLESMVTNFENLTELTNSAMKSQITLGNKLESMVTKFEKLTEHENIVSLSNACMSKIPAPVDEYFDALASGRKEWRLAFKGTAYNNVPIYPAYIHGTGIPSKVEDGCKQFNYSLPCANHYRNKDALENWQNVDEVLFAVYVKGQMVKRILFNAKGSTFTSWFSADRVISSSWDDLTSLSHNIFSIIGDTHPQALRRFEVNHSYHGCPYDKGWFFAGDAVPGLCSFEKKLAAPMFLYSKGKTVALLSSPEQVARADSVGIFIKYE
ncbi:hypothetical protein PoB_005311900 [Plakobranchus ocellatus]|uniref:Fibrinogen C-terminal domain-containing protein n=1 Tax=Plakobranchus ocellatus TaxID=259542 RepID=A0AAV4C261_9GAST|nr:hypothetical protein PoB_005311900 [Plakobranchus ocellatus]